MKAHIATAALLLSNASAACEYIEGHWRSNKELSMNYNYSHASLDKNTIFLLEQIVGHLTIEISGNSYHQQYAPTVNVNIDERIYPHSFEEAEHKVTFLDCSNELVTINHPVHGVGTAYFDGADVYWVSPFGTWREYFVRAQ